MAAPTPLKAGREKINPYLSILLVKDLFGHQLRTVEMISDLKYALKKSNNTNFCLLMHFFSGQILLVLPK